MSEQIIDSKQGHWILAKMGKKVLRPGGKELTQKLIDNLNITNADDIVEFAPGLGFTANIALQKNPKSYTGVDLNKDAVAFLEKKITGKNRKVVVGNASNSNLDSECANKVYGEAMLTMQADHRKSDIIKEAYRLLKKDGYYGIHELGLTPNTIDENLKADIQKQLAIVIKVNARPLTVEEWENLLKKEGFSIVSIETNPMLLLEPSRVIDDEGFFRTLKIMFNIITHPNERKRILAMRKTFKKYKNHLNAIAIIAKKN